MLANPDWTQTSHGVTTPNYATAFPQGAVNTIEITMTAAQWGAVRTDMTALFGADFGVPNQAHLFPSVDPAYQSVNLRFGGKNWHKVGFRLKGNSSLFSAWTKGIYKLPFRLNLDEFETNDPAVKDQRFYGFKELSFSAGFSDNSLIREKLTADVLRTSGIPTARTAFYRVYIDIGTGLKYWGLYTLVEVIDDTMVRDQFGEDDGNIYKPETNLVVYNEQDFEKKNNKMLADYADVQSLVAILNDPVRLTNAALWRSQLEAAFDVDHFLKWLAINTALVNWDSYGALPHNFYLYHRTGGKLVWIPWDHNEAMKGSPGISTGDQHSGRSLSMGEVSALWPLIRNLLDDATYVQHYRSFLHDFNVNVLSGSSITVMADAYSTLISPYVIGASGEQAGYTLLASPGDFASALPALKAHLQARRTLISGYLP